MNWIQWLKYRGCWIVDIEHRGFRNLNARGTAGFASEGKTEQVSNQNPQVRGKTGNLGVVHKLLDDFQGPPEPDPSLCNTAIILASPLPP